MSAYRLDKTNSKLMGVCAGLSNATGLDLALVRVGVVLLTLVLGPITVLAYLLTGWIAN